MNQEEFAQAQERQRLAAEEFQAQRDAQIAEEQRLIGLRGKTQFDPKTQPDFFKLNLEQREREAQEREAAEKARLASINPREVWISTLPYEQQLRIRRWELANPGFAFPMPKDFVVELKEQ